MAQYLKPNSNGVASKVVDGEAILINLSNGMYYSMDAVGGYIWSLIEAGYEVDSVINAVTHHYRVDEEMAKNDVQNLVQQLLDEELVVASGNGVSAEPIEAVESPESDSYTSPHLNKFDDMVDLFALDPPLPELSKLSGKDRGYR